MSQPIESLALRALAAAIGAAFAFGAAAQKGPRTPWGDPDITGAYAEFTTAPLERPDELGDKEFYSSREEHDIYAARKLADADQDDETVAGTPEDVHYDMGTFALSENEGVTSLNMRTSIVNQPKNGKIPPLTAAAKARVKATSSMARRHVR
jgi:hypothetical protein